MFLDNKSKYSELLNEYRRKYRSNCKRCKGTGLIDKNGISVVCECEKKIFHIVSLIKNGIPERIINYVNWEDLISKYKNDAIKMQKYTKDIDNIGNLMIFGESNKEIKEILTALSLDLKNRKIIMISVNNLIQLYNDFNTKASVMKVLVENKDNSILILNNFGNEPDSKTEYTSKVLSEILQNRVDNGKINIVSTLLDKKIVMKKYDNALISIFKDSFIPITMKYKVQGMTNELFSNDKIANIENSKDGEYFE